MVLYHMVRIYNTAYTCIFLHLCNTTTGTFIWFYKIIVYLAHVSLSNPNPALCRAKRQYLLIFHLSSYCLFALQSGTARMSHTGFSGSDTVTSQELWLMPHNNFNSFTAKLFNWNFHPLEVVSR